MTITRCSNRFLPMRRTLVISLFPFLLAGGCSLFEPRDPEPPTQSGLNLPAPVTPEIVWSNLESAISYGKDAAPYMDCFTNPATNPSRGFTFVPSPDFRTLLQPWNWTRENSFIQDLISKRQTNGVSNLVLTQASTPLITSDSVDYQFFYSFIFETNGLNLTSRAHGRLEFKIGLEENRTRWSIYYWADNPENTGDTTWSWFKWKFQGS